MFGKAEPGEVTDSVRQHCGVEAGIVRTGTVFEFEVAPHLTNNLLGLFFHLQFLYLLITNVWGPV